MDAISLVADALWRQSYQGRAIVDGNEGIGGETLWGLVYKIHNTDPELAEKVRRAFCGKSPQEALTAVRALRSQKTS